MTKAKFELNMYVHIKQTTLRFHYTKNLLRWRKCFSYPW